MGRVFACGGLDRPKTELGQINASEKVFSLSQQDRRERQMHFIDLACCQELANGRNTAARPRTGPNMLRTKIHAPIF